MAPELTAKQKTLPPALQKKILKAKRQYASMPKAVRKEQSLIKRREKRKMKNA